MSVCSSNVIHLMQGTELRYTPCNRYPNSRRPIISTHSGLANPLCMLVRRHVSISPTHPGDHPSLRCNLCNLHGCTAAAPSVGSTRHSAIVQVSWVITFLFFLFFFFPFLQNSSYMRMYATPTYHLTEQTPTLTLVDLQQNAIRRSSNLN
jgi:hypothetical protein